MVCAPTMFIMIVHSSVKAQQTSCSDAHSVDEQQVALANTWTVHCSVHVCSWLTQVIEWKLQLAGCLLAGELEGKVWQFPCSELDA